MPEPTRNLSVEWQELLAEWERAVADYRTAGGGDGAAGDNQPPDAAAGNPEMEAAARRVADIKRKMEGVIAAGKADRSARNRGESLIVKMADDFAGDPPAAPEKGDAGV